MTGDIGATTLTIRIPMRFGRHRGSKRIVASGGRELVPAPLPQPDGMPVKALARAWRWRRLDKGTYLSVEEIARVPASREEQRRDLARL
jgi:hypothetical protein